MKTKNLFLLTLWVACAAAMAAPTNWTPLFNGKSLSGWRQLGGKAEYRVQDGAIVGVSKKNTPNSFLATKKMYGDFILELEYKVDNELNSGIQFRSNSDKSYQKGQVHGYQYEIDTSPRRWSAGIYDEGRRGWLYAMESNPAAKNAFKANEWNKVRIEAIGNSIRTWLNGVPCANLLDNTTPQGFIALQVHSIYNDEHEGKEIAWRNIRICVQNIDQEQIPDYGAIPQVNSIDNTISPREEEEGWQLLWDGVTSNGWRAARATSFPTNGWKIENGLLKVLRGDGGESTYGGDIVTTKKYKNFELRVDFKITEGANSGIKYFVDTEMNQGAGSSIGCEFQILDDKLHPDSKLGVNHNRQLGSLYDLIPAPQNKPYRGNWCFNTARIVVKDNKVEHWLNDVKIVEYERGTQQWRALVAYSKYRDWPLFGEMAEGHILLQDHGDEVWFKNIKIKELK